MSSMSTISQSVAWWCYVPEKLTAVEFVQALVEAGYSAIDLDETQEIYYPPILQAIKETRYRGYIAHEFIPKGDPVACLRSTFQRLR